MPRGQTEAAKALSLRYVSRMKDVVLPQALRISLPATIGFLVQLIKGTSLAAIVGFTELSRAGNIVSNQIFKPLLVFGIVGHPLFRHLLAALALWRAAGTQVCRGRALKAAGKAWTDQHKINRRRDDHEEQQILKPNRRESCSRAPPLLAMPALMTRSAFAITPAEIKTKGKVVIGIQGDNPPWGFVNSAGKQEGLDADIAELFGKDLGVPVEFVPLEVANRIPALTAGRVDLLFATMAMLPERAKAVQFSKPYVANMIVLLAPKTTEIKTNADMGKLTIARRRAPAPRTPQVTKNAPAGTNILRFDGDAAAIQALVSGQAQALGGNIFYIRSLGGGEARRLREQARILPASTTAPARGSARRRSTPPSTPSSTRSRPMASWRRSTRSG